MKIALGKSCFHPSWIPHVEAIGKSKCVDVIDVQSIDLEDFFRKNGTKYLFVLCFGDCFYLESCEFSASLKTSILFTSKYHISLLDDKIRFLQYFIANDMQNYIPKTYIIMDNGIETIYDNNIRYPIVIKPRHGMSGSNVRICENQTAFENTIYNYGQSYAVQEYIKYDRECSGYFVCDKGKILARVTCEGVSGTGLYIKSKRVDNPIYNTSKIVQFDIIFEKLGYSGFANVDFKIINKQLYIFEINPRIGGDLICNENIMLLLDQLD